MIVQSADIEGFRRVIPLEEHLKTAHQLWRAWGSAVLPSPEPRRYFAFVVRHHDDGWKEVDRDPEIDPSVGLPFSLDRLPLERLIAVGTRSVDLAERYHPFCGLLTSLHMSGLYEGRYGVVAAAPRPAASAAPAPLVQDFLRREDARRTRLKQVLEAGGHAAWGTTLPGIFRAYATLQILDSLAVWLNLRSPVALEDRVFLRIPSGLGPGESCCGYRPMERPCRSRHGLSAGRKSGSSFTAFAARRCTAPRPSGAGARASGIVRRSR